MQLEWVTSKKKDANSLVLSFIQTADMLHPLRWIDCGSNCESKKLKGKKNRLFFRIFLVFSFDFWPKKWTSPLFRPKSAKNHQRTQKTSKRPQKNRSQKCPKWPKSAKNDPKMVPKGVPNYRLGWVVVVPRWAPTHHTHQDPPPPSGISPPTHAPFRVGVVLQKQ